MYSPHKKHRWTPYVAALVLIAVLLTAFYLLNGILTPFVAAAVLAYILNPLVESLQRHRIGRSFAAMLVMLLALLLLAALLLVVVPMLVGQIQKVIQRVPVLIAYIQNTLLPWFNTRFGDYAVLDPNHIEAWLRANMQAVQSGLQQTTLTLARRGSAVAAGLGNLVMLPLLLYYFLLDWARWTRGIRNLIPRRYLAVYDRVGGKIDTALSEFLRGQLTVMLIMGLLYGTGLWLTGLESGFAIGMVAGLLVFVPYLGMFTGLMLATLAALLQFNGWGGLLAVWGVFAVGQVLEGFFITPKIVGDRIGLSPFWVIFSLMAFGNILGFVGLLAALPLAAVCLVLLREACQTYTASAFYRRLR